MAMKSWAFALVALGLLALATPSSAAAGRKVLSTCDADCDHLNKALASAYLKANFFHCAAYGKPIPSSYCGGGPAPQGCKKAVLSVNAQAYAESMAQDALKEITAIRAVLQVNAIAQPLINIQANIRLILNAAINVDLGTLFDCFADDRQFYLGAFIIADLDLNIKLAVRYLLKVQAYIDVLVNIIPTCQNYVSLIQAQLLVFADVILFPSKCGLTIKAIVNLCISYLDCGLSSVLGLTLGVILGPILNLVLLLGINLTALLNVLVNLVAILKVCVFL